MTLQDLTKEERLALGGLVRAMLRVDGSYSAEESERLESIAEDLGDAEGFWAALEEAEQTISTPEALRAATAAVTRKEAHQLIVDVLEGVAEADTKSEAEQRMLDELAALWGMGPTAPYR